jgi:hypothetical protein
MTEFNRILPNLDPESDYVVRVRAYNQIGVESEWSESISFETPGDSSVPNPPSSLSIDFTSPNMVVTWAAPTQNTDNTNLTDLDHYRIKLEANSITKFYETRFPYFIYSFNENKIDFGLPQPVITVTVSTVDVGGNESNSVTGTGSNIRPANPPDPPFLATGFTTISVSMSPASSTDDVKGYDLYHSDDGVTYALLANVTGDTYVHGVAGTSTHYYKFKVVDIFDQISTGFSPVASTTTEEVLPPPDLTPPTDTTGLSGTPGIDSVTQMPYIDLAWTANTDSDLASYEIRFRKSGDSIFTSVYKGSDFTSHRLRDLPTGGTYEVQLRAVDLDGNKSTWSPVSPLSVVVPNGNVYWEPTSFGGIVIDSSGYVKSSNWITGSTGWKLDSTGLQINDGTISANALQIGISTENLVVNSSFENGTTTATNWTSFGTGTFAIDTSVPLYQSKYQKITTSTLQTSIGVYQDISVSNGRLVTALAVGDYVTVSAYGKRTGGSSFGFVVELIDEDNSLTYTSTTTTLTNSSQWYRASKTVHITAVTSSLRIRVYGVNVPSSSNFGIDGAMLTLSSYPATYAPATLEIPDNYITSAYISTLSADKLTAGRLNAGVIDIGASGWIQSLDWTTSGGTTGYRLDTTGVTFQNGSVTLIGAGGSTTFDSTSFRMVSGATTKFKVDSTGVYIGGSSSATAQIYFDTSSNTTTFQSTASGYKLIIDTSASDANKIMKLRSGSTDTFYLKSDGSAYFGAGIIGIGNGSGGFNVDANGNIWQGTAASYAAATAFKVSAAGALSAPSGSFGGSLSAATGSFSGTITASTISGSTISAAGGAVVLDSSGIRIDKGTGVANAIIWGSTSSFTGNSSIWGGGATLNFSTPGTGGTINATCLEGGFNIIGNLDSDGTVNGQDGLRASSGGVIVTGNSTITGTLNVTSTLSQGGNAVIHAGNIGSQSVSFATSASSASSASTAFSATLAVTLSSSFNQLASTGSSSGRGNILAANGAGGSGNADIWSFSFTQTGGGYNTFSSRDAKTDIVDWTDIDGLAAIRALRFRKFKWIESGAPDSGFVADEVPVSLQSGEGWSISKLVLNLAHSVQQLENRLIAAESEIVLLKKNKKDK